MESALLRAYQTFGKEIEQGTPWPRPRCRICQEGCVSWDKPITAENNQSKKLHNHPGFDPEWIAGTIHTIGRCQNDECEQVVIAVGTYKVDYSHNRADDGPDSEYRGPQYSEFYKLNYFHPPLALPLPEAVPKDVLDAIDRAVPLLFIDPSFAATALRASVELFLTGQGILAGTPEGNRRSLHQRIELWGKEAGNQRVAEQFLAVKWLGNQGTHEGEPHTVSDVLDGLEFIESAFHELFVAPEIDLRVKAVNQAKGRYRANGPTAG